MQARAGVRCKRCQSNRRGRYDDSDPAAHPNRQAAVQRHRTAHAAYHREPAFRQPAT
ncbi:hypothetical protein XAP6164_790002 [Xanthomonas phaseoli pv. phaseoli]|nr:hypothetical protein XAP6164_790002 [Xanthomonas phaseoli pv. phaseoli]